MSGERIYPEEIKTLEEYLIYLKEVFIYTWCKEKISKDARCLDVGCGEGYGTKLLSSSAKETVGIDIDKKIIEKASKNTRTIIARINFIMAKIFLSPITILI